MISEIVVLLVLTMINAFFAATEMAFISLNDIKVEKMAKEGNKKAKQIQKMLKNPSKFLATIQVGITLAGFLSSAIAADAFADEFAIILNRLIPTIGIDIWNGVSIVVITIILSMITLTLGELVPKRIAMKSYEKIAFGTVKIIKLLSIITAPIVKFLTFMTNVISKMFGVSENEEELVTEEEIKMMVDQGEEKGTIDEEAKELINNVFEFNDITVSEIMVHRKDIFAVDIDMTMEELLKELSSEEYRYSRIPVYDETIDEIKGIVYVKDLLKNINKKTFKLKSIMDDVYYVHQNKLINELFKELQKEKKQMAIVLDEYGGTAGLITMEDILEELVGDIFDEYDESEEEFKIIDENTYLISGSLPIYDVNKILNVEIPEGDYDTLSGFLQEEMGRIPEDEEKPIIETEKVTFKIEQYEDKRILWVKACKNNIEEQEENDETEE